MPPSENMPRYDTLAILRVYLFETHATVFETSVKTQVIIILFPIVTEETIVVSLISTHYNFTSFYKRTDDCSIINFNSL
jgi:hypothetical protein